ncbi:EAL domain-containing protein [Rhodoferax ferrireducens]|uniref:bifunctional diguanylate cyclase/phosphodiesterase n=1 Tax=Rhodoferax ferrireducens TaxID=192843 RepID=UPI000E0D7CE3|nr:EAL domain-containing protein [Rhodoferax ferrireducens]
MPFFRQPRGAASRAGPHLLIWLFATLLLTAGWLLTFRTIADDRSRTIAGAESDLVNLGRLSQEHAERTFFSADQTLRMVLGQYHEHGGQIDLKGMTEQGVFDPRILLQVGVIDAQGLLAQSNLPFSGRVDLSDREHFKAHVAPGSNALFISRPVLGRASGKWSIQLSRRITRKNGEFGGVVVASLDPAYFTHFFAELSLGHEGVSALYGLSGSLLARKTPSVETFEGNAASSPVFLRAAQGEENGTLTSRSVVDGIERTYHFRKLPSYPLLVVTGMASADVFAEHEQAKAYLLWQAGIASVLLLALGLMSSRYVVARQRHSAAQQGALLQLQTITSRAPGLLYEYLLRPDGSSCFPFASEGLREIYGLSPQEVAADAAPILALIHPDDAPGVAASVEASAQSLEPWVHEYRVRAADGTVRWLAGNAMPQKQADGSVLWHGFVFDTTRRNQHKAALMAEQARLQATLSAIPDLLFELGLDGRIYAYHSPRADLLAAPPEDFLGRKVSDILPPDAAAVGMAALQEANEYGHSSGTQYALDLPQGKMWFELSVARKARQDDEELRFIVLARDITERKLADAQLRIAATAFESEEGMFITDPSGLILRVNQAFSRITGFSASEAIGKKPSLLSSGCHDAAFYAAMRESIEQSGSWQGEIWNRRRNGEVFPEWLTITAVRDEQQTVTHYVSTLADITKRKAAEAEIQQMAYYDSLTGLPNRRLFTDRLQQALAKGARRHRNGALLFIDLDNFKNLNDTYGHDQGDMLLRQVAERLNYCVRDGDTVARFGGDEFVVMLQDLSDNPTEAATQARAVGQKMLDTLGQPYQFGHFTYHSSASVGVALFNENHDAVDELLKRADLALYQAKDAGRNTLRFFDLESQTALTARAELEADLRHSLQEREFLLYYQPQVNERGRLTGVEALLRWSHPRRGMVPPAHFIPLAEDTGLILPLGQWVLETACRQLQQWAVQPHTAHLTLSVNVSALQFHRETFVDDVLAVIECTGAPASRLKLELTESLLIKDMEGIISKMLTLKARGVGFSLDDFGTGYSSLSYLKRLPLDQLKIDRSFLLGALTNPKDAALVRATVTLGQSLGMMVIAEGVETPAQRDFLEREGCCNFQGYYFGHPGPVEALETFFNPE